jgi:hypothetical protein
MSLNRHLAMDLHAARNIRTGSGLSVLPSVLSACPAPRNESNRDVYASRKRPAGHAICGSAESTFAVVPSLHAFAISLCGNVDRADDLVKETLLRALTHIVNRALK